MSTRYQITARIDKSIVYRMSISGFQDARDLAKIVLREYFEKLEPEHALTVSIQEITVTGNKLVAWTKRRKYATSYPQT